MSAELSFLQIGAFFKPVWALARRGTLGPSMVKGAILGVQGAVPVYSLGVALSYSGLIDANCPSCKITGPQPEMLPELFPEQGWTTHMPQQEDS